MQSKHLSLSYIDMDLIEYYISPTIWKELYIFAIKVVLENFGSCGYDQTSGTLKALFSYAVVHTLRAEKATFELYYCIYITKISR